MHLFNNISIKRRLTFMIMLVSCISVLLTTLAISAIGKYNMQASIIGELDVSASVVGDRNVAILLFGTKENAEANLSVFSVKQSIVQACLYDQKGSLFARYANPQYSDESHCPADLRERSVISDKRIELMKSIRRNGDQVGSIYLESTLEQINRYIEKQVSIAVIVAGAALLISYLLAISLQRAISRPILQLAATARAVSAHKDYTIRAKVEGNAETERNNELVILTTSFNDMLSEISTRNQQLKAQNTELERAKDAAESANRAKSQFLASISHELRTPLNAIIGFSSILMNQLFGALGDEKYLEYARDINESGAHLLDIINDILDLSKAEAGKLTLNYEEVQISRAIGKCITILSERAEKGKVAISTDIPKTLPMLVADRLRFIQIILNILSNAVKFTQEGGKVCIILRTHEKEGEITYFIVTVEDTGIGMAEADIHQAFQSFGQVDSGLNRKYEGTGLGLPLTRKLMELHHGTILIESEPGKGTKVTLTFPAVPPPEAGYNPEL